jgi:hypothetical protein
MARQHMLKVSLVLVAGLLPVCREPPDLYRRTQRFFQPTIIAGSQDIFHTQP